MSDYMVTVCDACKTAACWHGTFMCQRSANAGTVDLSASELDKLGLEHPDYYSRERLIEVCGDVKDTPPAKE